MYPGVGVVVTGNVLFIYQGQLHALTKVLEVHESISYQSGTANNLLDIWHGETE